MQVKGSNEFYDGWLAYILGSEYDSSKSESFLCGYNTAKDTPNLSVVHQIAYCERVKQHIRVENASLAQ